MFAFFVKLVRRNIAAWTGMPQVGAGLRKLDLILTLNRDREFEGQNVMLFELVSTHFRVPFQRYLLCGYANT